MSKFRQDESIYLTLKTLTRLFFLSYLSELGYFLCDIPTALKQPLKKFELRNIKMSISILYLCVLFLKQISVEVVKAIRCSVFVLYLLTEDVFLIV